MGSIIAIDNKLKTVAGIPIAVESDRGFGWPIRWYMEMKGWVSGREYFMYEPVNPRKPNGAQRRISIKESTLHDIFRKSTPPEHLVIIEDVSRVLFLPEDFDRAYEKIGPHCVTKDCR
jgi:hypothetical protein